MRTGKRTTRGCAGRGCTSRRRRPRRRSRRGAPADRIGAFGARKSYAIPAAEVVGFAFLLNQVNRHTDGSDFDSNASTIRRNLHSSWVVDRDPFEVNQLGHPYQGSMYHAFARSAGLGYWASLGYAFAGSALWEIAGESALPSRNDQINTGIGGSFLGEILFRLANLTLEHESLPPFWREAGAALISPSVGFNPLAFGDRFRARSARPRALRTTTITTACHRRRWRARGPRRQRARVLREQYRRRDARRARQHRAGRGGVHRPRPGTSRRYLLNRRDAFYPDVGDSSQTRGTLGIFYTYLGHQRFGFVPWE